MEGMILLGGLVLLFVLLGLTLDEVTGPARLAVGTAIVFMTGWYLLF
jgi:hypothetical protein